MAELRYESAPVSVQDIIPRYENGTLNLTPGFQRQSVWKFSDRKKLIDSMLRGYPLPAVFMHRSQHGGRLRCNVIDGRQRLESILMFARRIRGESFAAKVQLPGSEERRDVDYKKLVRPASSTSSMDTNCRSSRLMAN